MPVITREVFAGIVAELPELAKAHWEEIANFKDIVPLDINYNRYYALEQSGGLHILAARDQGKLIGYSIFFIHQGLHYMSTCFALNDVVYLKPEYRNTGFGRKLIDESEKMCLDLGAHIISWHLKPGFDFGPLLEDKGYILAELAYSKPLMRD